MAEPKTIKFCGMTLLLASEDFYGRDYTLGKLVVRHEDNCTFSRSPLRYAVSATVGDNDVLWVTATSPGAALRKAEREYMAMLHDMAESLGRKVCD